jgi:hypothetical protein
VADQLGVPAEAIEQLPDGKIVLSWQMNVQL